MSFWRRFQEWFTGRSDRDLDREIRAHMDLEAEDQQDAGLLPEQARYAARRVFGNVTLVKEDTRAVWGWTLVEQLGQDVRYALGAMACSRTFTALAVISLALGIGANSAIYSFIESILLRSLPVPDPNSLVVMKWRARDLPSVVKGFSLSTGGLHRDPSGGMVSTVFPYPALELFQGDRNVLSGAFCYFGAGLLNVTMRGESEALDGQYVSGDYFRLMGVPPAAGRPILAADDHAGAAPIAVLSHRYSLRRFGSPSMAVGQSIRINNVPVTVVGVAPPGFFGADPGSTPNIWMPMHTNPLLQPSASREGVTAQYPDRNFYWIEIMGRLNPGVTPTQARATLTPRFRQFVEESASTDAERADLPELLIVEGATGLDSLRRKYSKALFVLMAMAGSILLIACANIANLLLARTAARQREIAVRLAMGAGRSRVIRQLLTENVLLALMGGALAVVFALWGIRFLTLLLGHGRDNFTLHAELNWHVLGVTWALALLTGLLFGLTPALHATRVDLTPALKQVRTGVPIRSALPRIAPSHLLIGAQIAFALVLLVAAGLFGRTLSNLHSVEVGFNRENVLLFTISPEAAGYERASLRILYRDLRQRLEQVPGVRAVSLSTRPLLSGSGTLAPIAVPGAIPDAKPVKAALFSVGPGFFKTMQIPLVGGREFDERDEAGPHQIVIVNQKLARLVGQKNPVGNEIRIRNSAHQIIGVVGDSLFFSLKEEPRPVAFLPLASRPPGQATFEVRAAGNPLHIAGSVREIVRGIDSRLALSQIKSQAAHIDQAIGQEIALAHLCGVFAVLALVIACVGIYGTVAYNMVRRTGEIGVRVALGARPAAIIFLVLREVLRPVLIGLMIGLPVVLAASHLVEAFVFGIEPNDPVTVAGVMSGLFVTALLAGYVPARRASRVDPMVALRYE